MTLEKMFPLYRVREIHSVMEWLTTKEKKNARASDIQSELNNIRGDRVTNVWWRLIDMFFEAYREETADSILPVEWAIDHLHEFIAEQRREKVLGQGIFMNTIHSAKGMEFPHVFILDGDWRPPSDKDRWEEERRVMYVGMTRAEETLHLLKIPERPNPFLREISGKFVMPLIYQDKIDNSSHVNRTYEILGLDDIYLDYAGNYSQTHSIHRHLANLETGQCVSFCRKKERIEIQNCEGICLARLSKQGVDKWMDRLDQILEIRVLAVLWRNCDDPEESFQEWIKADKWEIPVLDVVCQANIG
jgi:ATP-dependent DNA helicase RecQ